MNIEGGRGEGGERGTGREGGEEERGEGREEEEVGGEGKKPLHPINYRSPSKVEKKYL